MTLKITISRQKRVHSCDPQAKTLAKTTNSRGGEACYAVKRGAFVGLATNMLENDGPCGHYLTKLTVLGKYQLRKFSQFEGDDMALLDVLQLIRRTHAANGQLDEIRGHLTNIQRATEYNPRNSESWDIFGLRDDRLERISRSCGRAAGLFNQMARARATIRARSMDLSRLFSIWCAAFSAHGPESRQRRTAKATFAAELVNAIGDMNGLERDADEALVDLRKYKKFYALQQQIFARMADLAERFVRYWPTSTNAPKAFAVMQSSQDIRNHSRRIVALIDRAVSNLRTQKRAIRVERAQLDTWHRWLANDRNVQQDIARGRAPI